MDARPVTVLEGEYNEGMDRICPQGGRRLGVVADVDGTAVLGNFVAGAVYYQPARDALLALDKEHGLFYLSANYKFKEMREYFAARGYPAAPLITRAWRHVDNYQVFCNGGYSYDACEAVFKLERLLYVRDRCADDARMVGLGDKFCDYMAYRSSGVCPFIVDYGKARRVNSEAMAGGKCKQFKEGFFYVTEGTLEGGVCPVVPEKYIQPLPRIVELAKKYLAGEIACGEWDPAHPPPPPEKKAEPTKQ
jgi:hypothetical protein